VIAVSIDLDEARLYRAIHGLPPSEEAARPVFEVGVPRALAFARRLDLPLTFFCVAEDLEDEAARGAMRAALELGHAVESHSATHPYDLVRLPPAELDREVAGSFDRIEARLGVRPAGFRAPGYTVTDEVFDALERAGAAFDSSILPSPVYQAAKLGALGVMWGVGRRSASIAMPNRAALAPVGPYRPGRPFYRRGGRALLELPMLVTRAARIPVIGTSLGWAGPRMAPRMVLAAADTPLINLELHGVDFLDGSDAPDLAGLPELRAPLARRLAAFEAAIGRARATRRAVTLAEAARVLGATSPCT
jgi:hypothetical protein